ncbi:MAG: HXXEE domain-containing protein [Xanthobacteraceae bacterium]|nr:HXXEE domain-containing protein [Xanthobacteraceae bacterium]
MSLTVLAWLAVAAYALHVVEEHILGWYDWARKTMNISLGWDQYVITEAAILILGLTAAMLSGTAMGPTLVVAFATLLLINVIFFHLLPMLANRGKFSPGVISGIFLFLPLAWHVYKTQTLAQNDLIWAVVLGILLILWPMFLLKLKGVGYFSGAPARAKRKR